MMTAMAKTTDCELECMEFTVLWLHKG